ncbi:MAG TPA: ATP-binding protein [Candidatus Sulfotelmatobacter sp.]|nr:ATP-binding protein [Candidatus Sulfotelmatobacter sp.]
MSEIQSFEGLEERVRTTIALGEGHFTEFKSALHGPPEQKKKRPISAISHDIAEALVAFGNSDGGSIIIGVEDNRDITGLPGFAEDEIAVLRRAPVEGVLASSPLQNVRADMIRIDGKNVLYFSILKGTDFIYQTADGRAMKRRELATIPIAASALRFEQLEIASREFDRAFVDGATIHDLQESLVEEAGSKLQAGMTPWRFLQHYGLAEYSNTGLRLRRAALLLFAKDINRWHPRSQIRIVRVGGTELRLGAEYNAMPDKVVSGNIIELIRASWDSLREYLVVMRLTPEGTFQPSAIYPDAACQEALINAVAHRDYAQEGRGIEIFIFHDRIEIKSPGALLSTVQLDVLRSAKGIHESRNTFVAKTLKLLGYMQELGEGVRRIFSLMSNNELAPPILETTETTFSVTLNNKPVYSDDELLWLDRYKSYELSREEKAVLLLARGGRLLTTNEIMRAVGFTDTSDFTSLMSRLGKLGLIRSALKQAASRIYKAEKEYKSQGRASLRHDGQSDWRIRRSATAKSNGASGYSTPC